jgi:hypothetical protein
MKHNALAPPLHEEYLHLEFGYIQCVTQKLFGKPNNREINFAKYSHRTRV